MRAPWDERNGYSDRVELKGCSFFRSHFIRFPGIECLGLPGSRPPPRTRRVGDPAKRGRFARDLLEQKVMRRPPLHRAAWH
jgi:hypothetical protein